LAPFAAVALSGDGGGGTRVATTMSTTTEVPVKPRRSRLRPVVGWIVTIVVALLISTGTRAYAVQSYFVPTPSMTPTLMPGDRILVNKLSSTVHRGDIVVFNNPPADRGGPPTLVKRVIGLPGERISSIGSEILINGKPLAEPWLPTLKGQCQEASEHIPPTTVAAGHYFVMGDCRGDSDDSRYWGTVPSSLIVGKVDVIIWRHGHPWIHWF
jgi:signal peptidase I